MNPCTLSHLPNYDNPAELKMLMDSLGLSMQKKFGQNFLINRDTRVQLISVLDIDKNKKVWEIGAGLGAMTNMILEKGANLTAFEIDNGFISLLLQFFGTYNNFKLIQGDVQKNWKSCIDKNGKPDIFFGNLPYNIAAQLIQETLEACCIFDTLLITVQKETAYRIIAKPNNKNYTAFSLLCSLFYDCKIIKIIPPSAFWPKPHIDSAAVLFKPKKNIISKHNAVLCINIIKALFLSRRKNIKNNLTAWLHKNNYSNCADYILQKAHIKPDTRAESLFLDEFLSIANIINSLDKI